jgi:hypothetical protein
VLNGRVNAVDGRGFWMKFVISITSEFEITVGKVLSCVVCKAIYKKQAVTQFAGRYATQSPSKKELGK